MSEGPIKWPPMWKMRAVRLVARILGVRVEVR